MEVLGVNVGVGREKMESERSKLVLAEDVRETSDMSRGGRMKEGGSIVFQIFLRI